MVLYSNKEDCCGCSACANVCPHKAIEMKADGMGFLYPFIVSEKCVNCGLCKNVCSFKSNYDKSLNVENPLAFGVRIKDFSELSKSQSGGAFVLLSDKILESGGVVYGAGYDSQFKVIHQRATNKKERDAFRGSKYVQSELGNVLKQVKEDLLLGRKVMFSGTPCQTAACNSFVGTRLRERLFLVDIICHGVPSPFIWRDNINYLERKEKSAIISANFRDKKYGWCTHKETYIFSNNKVICRRNYTKLFYDHVMLRPSCGTCRFTNLHRPSDITIADLWGWDRTDCNVGADNKGLSLVIVNTIKVDNLVNQVKKDCYFQQVNLNDCMQHNLQSPTEHNPLCKQFEKDYLQYGYKYILKKYGKYSSITLLKEFINKTYWSVCWHIDNIIKKIK
jgi:NAD-dependent dihydropyrimidine dehydrogenase PreA subunit